MKAARHTGWLSSLIERAKNAGVDNPDIAAALEDSIVFRPMTLGKDGRNRLVGMMMDDEFTVTDLFNLPDEAPRTR